MNYFQNFSNAVKEIQNSVKMYKSITSIRQENLVCQPIIALKQIKSWNLSFISVLELLKWVVSEEETCICQQNKNQAC